MPIARALPFASRRPTPRAGLGQLAAHAWRVFTTRQSLTELDERMLQDLGVSRAQAEFEASRPIWKLFRS